MKLSMKISIGIALLLGMMFIVGMPAMAASATITLDSEEIGVGEAVQLTVAVSGASSAERPKINGPDGLSVQYTGTSNQIQIINGAFSSQLSYNYLVAGLKPGRYTIGPIEITAGNNKLRTHSVILTVTGTSASGGNSGGIPPALRGQNRPDTDGDGEGEPEGNDPLTLSLSLPKTTLYQGETVPITVKLLAGNVSLNEVSYPNLNPSDFIFGKLDKPLQTEKIIHGVPYKAVEFHTTMTPVKTGNIFLGPVSLNCNIIVKSRDHDDFFGDYFPNYQRQSVQVKSKRIQLHILPLPATGKPAGFSGGIGQFQLKAAATPQMVNQGDPLTVKLVLSGTGNLQAVNAPVLQNSNGFKVYDPQRKSTTGPSNGEVSFEQVLIPFNAQVKQIGPYVFSYFNPVAGKYQQISTPAIPVTVKANPAFNESPGMGNPGPSERFGRDLVFIKDSPGKLRLIKERFYYQPWFWILQLFPLLGLGACFFHHKQRKLLQSDTPSARAIRAANFAKKQLEHAGRALATGNSERLLDELHLIIRNYLAEKYNLNAAGMTGDVVDYLKGQEISESSLQKIKDFFAKYDFYRFTGTKMTGDDTKKMWEEFLQMIEDLNHSGKENMNGNATPVIEGKGVQKQ